MGLAVDAVAVASSSPCSPARGGRQRPRRGATWVGDLASCAPPSRTPPAASIWSSWSPVVAAAVERVERVEPHVVLAAGRRAGRAPPRARGPGSASGGSRGSASRGARRGVEPHIVLAPEQDAAGRVDLVVGVERVERHLVLAAGRRAGRASPRARGPGSVDLVERPPVLAAGRRSGRAPPSSASSATACPGSGSRGSASRRSSEVVEPHLVLAAEQDAAGRAELVELVERDLVFARATSCARPGSVERVEGKRVERGLVRAAAVERVEVVERVERHLVLAARGSVERVEGKRVERGLVRHRRRAGRGGRARRAGRGGRARRARRAGQVELVEVVERHLVRAAGGASSASRGSASSGASCAPPPSSGSSATSCSRPGERVGRIEGERVEGVEPHLALAPELLAAGRRADRAPARARGVHLDADRGRLRRVFAAT